MLALHRRKVRLPMTSRDGPTPFGGVAWRPSDRPVPALAADRPTPRNLSLIRLEEADRRVRRRLLVVRSLLQRAGVETRIAEGSAIAAEILLADENLRRRAIRANLLVRDRSIDRGAEALARRGFRRIGPLKQGGSASGTRSSRRGACGLRRGPRAGRCPARSRANADAATSPWLSRGRRRAGRATVALPTRAGDPARAPVGP
jgi:hypothetical protein